MGGEGRRVCLEPGEEVEDLDAFAFGDAASSTLLDSSRTVCPTAVNGECDRGELCVWTHNGFSGTFLEIAKVGEVSNLLARWADDQASSVKNRRGKVSYLYSEPDGGGSRFCVEPHARTGLDLFNDQASSAKLARKQKVCPAL